MTDTDPLLTIADIVKQFDKMAEATWRSYVSRGRAPQPDDPDDANGRPANRRTPRWRQSTIDRWKNTRRGQDWAKGTTRKKQPDE